MRTWTPEARAKQSALIHGWKPWTLATGAKTPEGKVTCSQNARRGKERRAAELEAAMIELTALKSRIRKLSRGKPTF